MHTITDTFTKCQKLSVSKGHFCSSAGEVANSWLAFVS